MKTITLLLLVLTVALIRPANNRAAQTSDTTSTDERSTIGSYMKRHDEALWPLYINGIGVGFWVTNQELIHSKRSPLFCFLKEPDNAQEILDAWIAKQRATFGYVNKEKKEYFGDALRVEVALLIAYEEAFPCHAPKR